MILKCKITPATVTQFGAGTFGFGANLRQPSPSNEKRAVRFSSLEMQVFILSGVDCWGGRDLEKPVI